MRIIPAIDISGGKCVRLAQGDFGQMKVYREDPLEVALEFQNANLKYLHLVDLDGAKQGEIVNWDVINAIQERTALRVDFGGGVKKTEDVEQLLDLGIHQINIGSLAVKEPDTFKKWMKAFGPENFVLSADVRNEDVLINGWLESTKLRLFDLISQFEQDGLAYLCCTDITHDGMLNGPNLTLYKKLINKYPNLNIIASGGVSSIEDIQELNYLKVEAVIIGKALYEKRITPEQLLQLKF